MNDLASKPETKGMKPVDLRKTWTREDGNFTRWLAKRENLDVLGETLGFDLELQSVEKQIGSFRADVVCKRAGAGEVVLIENQMEPANHDRLGKILACAAGLKALTVVWIAKKFRPEHRAALDWLNEITRDDTRFFALEIALRRTGNSPVAPEFNIVSAPNESSRSVAPAANGAKRSAKHLKWIEYWGGLQNVLDNTDGPVAGNRKPQARLYMDYPVKKTGFCLQAYANTREKYVRAGLYIKSKNRQKDMDLLKRQKEKIEKELGYPLEWGVQKPQSRDKIIGCYFSGADPEDESDRHSQHKWLARHLNDLHRAFAPRLQNL